LKIYIPQGSIASSRSGGDISNRFIKRFLQNVPVIKFWKSVNILVTIWTHVCSLEF